MACCSWLGWCSWCPTSPRGSEDRNTDYFDADLQEITGLLSLCYSAVGYVRLAYTYVGVMRTAIAQAVHKIRGRW